jgi:hypothetical protein
VHHSFSKLERILTLIIIGKEIKICKFYFEMHLNIFVSNMFLIWKLWILKCVFNKSYSFLCYLKHGYIIYKQYRPI